MTQSSYSSDDQDIRDYSSSSSESSFSSESDVEYSRDSDVSSDGLEMGLNGRSEAQQKFKRLRRIFLNRPTKVKAKEKNQPQKRTANQVQSMLEQAMDELQFLKKQEERALESQSYALRLEVFQQQYLNKVAEIEDEMYAAIQNRHEECDATILAAAKKLQDQTQHALGNDLAMMNREPIDQQLDSSSVLTDSSSASQPK
ncbi:hypothetical protein JG687_00000976, partial [Phytophthora cactorum]